MVSAVAIYIVSGAAVLVSAVSRAVVSGAVMSRDIVLVPTVAKP